MHKQPTVERQSFLVAIWRTEKLCETCEGEACDGSKLLSSPEIFPHVCSNKRGFYFVSFFFSSLFFFLFQSSPDNNWLNILFAAFLVARRRLRKGLPTKLRDEETDATTKQTSIKSVVVVA